MRWVKVIALVIAVIVVFSVISTVLHALFWIGLGVVIAAVAVGALKARSVMRGRRVAGDDSGTRSAPPAPPARELGTRPNPAGRPLDVASDAARRHQDVEEELARLKRELE